MRRKGRQARSHLARVAALCATLTCLCGCADTTALWSDAGRERASVKRLVGVAPPTHAGGPRLLVIAYRDVGASTPPPPFYVTVPLDPEGRPAYPFGYSSTGDDVVSVVSAVPAEQLRAVESARLPPYRAKRGDAVDKRNLTYRGTGARLPPSEVTVLVFSRSATHSASPLWPARTTNEAEMDARMETFRAALRRLAADENLLLLPRRQPRPRGQVVSATARAVLLTPVTLTLDAVDFALAPIGLLVWRGM